MAKQPQFYLRDLAVFTKDTWDVGRRSLFPCGASGANGSRALLRSTATPLPHLWPCTAGLMLDHGGGSGDLALFEGDLLCFFFEIFRAC